MQQQDRCSTEPCSHFTVLGLANVMQDHKSEHSPSSRVMTPVTCFMYLERKFCWERTDSTPWGPAGSSGAGSFRQHASIMCVRELLNSVNTCAHTHLSTLAPLNSSEPAGEPAIVSDCCCESALEPACTLFRTHQTQGTLKVQSEEFALFMAHQDTLCLSP